MIDAIDFILTRRESVGGGTTVGGPAELWSLLGLHLAVSGAALLAACVVALPLALWLGHIGRGQALAAGLANAGRAVPTFAVVVFTSTYAVFGLTSRNLAFALALLAVPPIFINGYVGVRQVDRDVVDAAHGMGLTGAQVVRRVELPMALPLIFGGIRTSAVNVVATATLGPFVGVLTLGDWIVNANVYGEAGRIAGALVVALLAVACELLFAGLQRAVTPQGLRRQNPPRRKHRMRKTAALVGAMVTALTLAACGGSDSKTAATTAAAPSAEPAGKVIARNAANATKPTLTIGSKNFTEQFVLGEIYAQALEAAGYRVKRQLDLGSEQIAYKALKAGRVDAYPEYTGTALTSFYKVKIADVPKDPQAAYRETKADAAKDGITALAPTPFTDSNGFAMTQAGAEKAGGVKNLSDLAGKASSLVLAGPPECRQRADCKLGLESVYGLRFKRFIPIDLAKRHEVLTKGQADVSLVFTTDGQIKTEKLVLLGDDKKLFPPYNVTLLARDGAVKDAGPDFAKVVQAVQQGLSTEVMQELNSRVDIDKSKPAAVARQYLQESGYVK